MKGCLTKILIISATMSLGYCTGKNLVSNKTETDLYKIIKEEDKHYLKSKEDENKIILRTINNKTYGGTLEHQIQGIKELKKQGDTYE